MPQQQQRTPRPRRPRYHITLILSRDDNESSAEYLERARTTAQSIATEHGAPALLQTVGAGLVGTAADLERFNPRVAK